MAKKKADEVKVEKADEQTAEIVVAKEPIEIKQEKTVIDKSGWKPKTSLGVKVKNGEITNIDEILDKRLRILEPEIVDMLLPNLATDLLLIGQSKGKFGGGQRRVFKQTQKKTQE